jgi:hypothetical protein
MIIPPKHAAVNWIDGMSVSHHNFLDTENYFIDSIRDVASVSVNSFNFGLLPPLKGSGAQLSSYEVSKTATNQVQIRLHECQAITSAGMRISISGTEANLLSKSINLVTENKEDATTDNSKEYYYVIITVQPFERNPTGHPDPEEVPIRQPYTQPKYDIQVSSSNNVNIEELGGYHLVIGRLIRNGDDFFKDENFIPPCSSINSYSRLSDHYEMIGIAIDNLQNLSLQIIGKINYKNQKSEIAQNIKAICKTIIDFSSRDYFYLRNIVHQQPPIFLVSNISALANSLFTSIQTMSEKDKEELLNYFFEWNDLSPVTFLNHLSDIIEINYSHYQTGAYMKAIRQLLQSLVLVLQKLNTLEYIGQHKENIVVKEEVMVQSVKERKGWSFLD